MESLRIAAKAQPSYRVAEMPTLETWEAEHGSKPPARFLLLGVFAGVCGESAYMSKFFISPQKKKKSNNQERVSEAEMFELQVEVKPPVKGEELLPAWLCFSWDDVAST